MANGYISIIYTGIIATMFFNVTSAILRGVGDSRTPLYFLIVSSFLNIALDLFFIVTLHMGPEGAALATVLSQAAATVLCFLYMFRKFDILKIQKEHIYLDIRSCRDMLSLGIPMAINYSVTAIGIMILQSAINVFGSSMVASYTAASKVEQLATQPMATLGTTMATYCGQNLGAGKYHRIFKGMNQALLVGFAICGLGAVVTMGCGDFIMGWFLSAPSGQVMAYGRQYLATITCFFVPLMFIHLYRNALQGLNKGLMPLLSGILEMICRITAITLLLKRVGFWAVCFASPTAWVGAGVPLFFIYCAWARRTRRRLQAASTAGSPADSALPDRKL